MHEAVSPSTSRSSLLMAGPAMLKDQRPFLPARSRKDSDQSSAEAVNFSDVLQKGRHLHDPRWEADSSSTLTPPARWRAGVKRLTDCD